MRSRRSRGSLRHVAESAAQNGGRFCRTDAIFSRIGQVLLRTRQLRTGAMSSPSLPDLLVKRCLAQPRQQNGECLFRSTSLALTRTCRARNGGSDAGPLWFARFTDGKRRSGGGKGSGETAIQGQQSQRTSRGSWKKQRAPRGLRSKGDPRKMRSEKRAPTPGKPPCLFGAASDTPHTASSKRGFFA